MLSHHTINCQFQISASGSDTPDDIHTDFTDDEYYLKFSFNPYAESYEISFLLNTSGCVEIAKGYHLTYKVQWLKDFDWMCKCSWTICI